MANFYFRLRANVLLLVTIGSTFYTAAGQQSAHDKFLTSSFSLARAKNTRKIAGIGYRLVATSIYRASSSGGTWQPADSEAYYYPTANSNRKDFADGFSYTSGGWSKAYKGIYYYSPAGDSMSYHQLTWNNNTGKYDTAYRQFETYNSNRKLTTWGWMDWDLAANRLKKTNEYIYLYDSRGRDSLTVTQYGDPISDTWVDVGKLYYVYSSGTSNAPERAIDSDLVGNVWTYAGTRYFFNNSFGDCDSSKEYSAAGVPTLFQYFSYVKPGLLGSTYYEGNTTSAGQWSKLFRDDNTYNSNDQILQQTKYVWKNGTWSIADYASQLNYYYETYTTTSVRSTTQSINLSVCPNPASTELKIDMHSLPADNYQIGILDLQGQLVRSFNSTLAGDVELHFPIDKLPGGQYLLQISGRSLKAVKSFSVVR